MVLFEWTLLLLLGAVLLSAVANRLKVPYPAFLALGGAALAFVPHAPEISLNPELVLALFVAPVLLDAAFDTSLRDLKRVWLPVGGLVVMAVAVTIVAVALVAKLLVPDLPWGAAVTLGAIVAPPDAAATAVLRSVRLPQRLLVILEGESLLNDASALLVYKFAVAATLAGTFSPTHALPQGLLVVGGSLAGGILGGVVLLQIVRRVHDIPAHILLQFLGTFGTWILADRLGGSGILAVVAQGVTAARGAPMQMSARFRVPSYAVWDTVTFMANVLAFLLIGLQLRPTLAPLPVAQRWEYLGVAAAVLAATIVARFAWVMTYNALYRRHVSRQDAKGVGRDPNDPVPLRPTVKSGLVLAWCGMRGIVTLAAALALPDGSAHGHGGGLAAFPHRDLIVVCAFSVVLGTLVLQGFTIRPVLRRFALADDGAVEREVNLARCTMFNAAINSLDGDQSPAATALRAEYRQAIDEANAAADHQVPRHLAHEVLRRRTVAAARETIGRLRQTGRIGDTAYHRIEEDLDWLELSVGGDGDEA